MGSRVTVRGHHVYENQYKVASFWRPALVKGGWREKPDPSAARRYAEQLRAELEKKGALSP